MVMMLKRKCQMEVIYLLIKVGLFPVDVHSVPEFELKFRGGRIDDFKAFYGTRFGTSLGALQTFKNVRGLIRREVFTDACRKMSTSLADIASITACTSEFVHYT